MTHPTALIFFAPLSLLFSLVPFQVIFLASFFCLSEGLNVCVCVCGWLGLCIVELCLSSYHMQQLSSIRCLEHNLVGFQVCSGCSRKKKKGGLRTLSVNVSGQEKTRGDSKVRGDGIHWFKCSLERKWRQREDEGEWLEVSLLGFVNSTED